MFSIKVSRSDLVKLYQYGEKGGPHGYDEHLSSGPRPVKLCLIVQTTNYLELLGYIKINCRNLIRTIKFKYSFRGLGQLGCLRCHFF